jgi:hypothetical protein
LLTKTGKLATNKRPGACAFPHELAPAQGA